MLSSVFKKNESDYIWKTSFKFFCNSNCLWAPMMESMKNYPEIQTFCWNPGFFLLKSHFFARNPAFFKTRWRRPSESLDMQELHFSCSSIFHQPRTHIGYFKGKKVRLIFHPFLPFFHRQADFRIHQQPAPDSDFCGFREGIPSSWAWSAYNNPLSQPSPQCSFL